MNFHLSSLQTKLMLTINFQCIFDLVFIFPGLMQLCYNIVAFSFRSLLLVDMGAQMPEQKFH